MPPKAKATAGPSEQAAAPPKGPVRGQTKEQLAGLEKTLQDAHATLTEVAAKPSGGQAGSSAAPARGAGGADAKKAGGAAPKGKAAAKGADKKPKAAEPAPPARHSAEHAQMEEVCRAPRGILHAPSAPPPTATGV